MKLLVRDAKPDDAESIVGILNPIIEAGVYTAFDTTFTVEQERDYIDSFPPRVVFHVAVRCHDQRIVGFQSMEPFASFTHAFDHVGVLGSYVELSCRRRGIATRLFEATFAAARRRGFEKIFTYVRADNPAALRVYGKQGFVVVGTARRHLKTGSKYIDAMIIERFL